MELGIKKCDIPHNDMLSNSPQTQTQFGNANSGANSGKPVIIQSYLFQFLRSVIELILWHIQYVTNSWINFMTHTRQTQPLRLDAWKIVNRRTIFLSTCHRWETKHFHLREIHLQQFLISGEINAVIIFKSEFCVPDRWKLLKWLVS